MQGAKLMTINLTFWLVLVLCISVIGNIFLFWYSRRVLSSLVTTGENLTDLVDLLKNYSSHIKSVYQLEQYYGDDDIKKLIAHTNNVIEIIESDYSDALYVTSIIEYEEDNENEENNETKEISQENVFYAGTREGNT